MGFSKKKFVVGSAVFASNKAQKSGVRPFTARDFPAKLKSE